MNPADQRRHRLRFVVEKDFQYRFTLKICLIGGLVFLVFGGIFLFIIKINYDMLIQDALIQMPDMVSELRREFRLLSLGMITALIVMVGVLFGLGLYLTQRVAGPLFALKRRLHDFAEGKTGVRLKLRTEDEFHELEASFNAAMESHDRRRGDFEKELTELQKLIRASDNDGAAQKLQSLLERPNG